MLARFAEMDHVIKEGDIVIMYGGMVRPSSLP